MLVAIIHSVEVASSAVSLVGLAVIWPLCIKYPKIKVRIIDCGNGRVTMLNVTYCNSIKVVELIVSCRAHNTNGRLLYKLFS